MTTRNRSTAEVLSEAGLLPKGNGQKVKADIAHGQSICRGIALQVEAIMASLGYPGVVGVPEFKFSESYGPVDIAWKKYGIAFELQGHEYHHRRKDFTRWFNKHAALTMNGWRVFYATADQAEKTGALWVTLLMTPKEQL